MIQRSYAELAGAIDRLHAIEIPPNAYHTAEAFLQEMQGAAIQVQCGKPIGLLTDAKRRATAYAANLPAPGRAQLAEVFKDQAASFRRRLGR